VSAPPPSELPERERIIKTGELPAPPDASEETQSGASDSSPGVPPPGPLKALRTAKSHRTSETSAPRAESARHVLADEIPHADNASRAGAPSHANNMNIDGPPLREATLEYWQTLAEDERKACHEVIDLYYHNLLEDFRRNANDAVQSYATYETRNKQWRLTMICLTGGLALINVAATSFPGTRGPAVRVILSFAAAIYAVILALFTNIESYLHYNDRKTTTRESRELYLDAYREFEMLRLRYVYPYGYDAHACYNFNALYQRLVAKDLELRRKIMQVSTTRTGAGKE
jgi:hypothetical protein